MTEREQMLEELRPQAFAVAYRMLGSVAEDVVRHATVPVLLVRAVAETAAGAPEDSTAVAVAR